MARIWLILGAIACALPFHAYAQRRGETGTLAEELRVELPTTTRFGEITVPARPYRVQISGDNLVLANPDTMEVQATLHAVVAGLPAAVPAGKAEVQTKGNEVLLVVLVGDKSYTAKGQKAALPKAVEAEAPEPTKTEREAVATSDLEAKTPAAKVAQAVQRYLPGLAACIDGAQKGKWITDDPRFSNCVCPVALKWQMPHLDAPLRMHQKLVKGKFGMSFTVGNDGKVSQCRVWAGARAPEMEPKPAAAQGRP